MSPIKRFLVAAGLSLLAGTVAAQTTSKTVVVGEPKYTVAQLRGTVVAIDGNWLLAQMIPSGSYWWFNVPPDREFVIDGKSMNVTQLKPGTVLTGTVVTKTMPVDVRTTTITNGTVLSVHVNKVTVRLENGERRNFTVPDSFRFNVDGKPLSVRQLEKGMRLTATKVVSDPETEFSSLTVITGRAPK